MQKGHSKFSVVDTTKYCVNIFPALEDNFTYLIVDKRSKSAALVDPADPDVVLNSPQLSEVDLKFVLTTHHHWDHAQGNETIKCKFPSVEIIGGSDRVNAVSRIVKNDDEIMCGDIRIRCLCTPCHTTDHVCYFIDDEHSSVFTGDTLFIGGCGRFFEGTPEQMFYALCKALYSLPENCKVFVGHEYTIANYKYALKVEPKNKEILEAMHIAKRKREDLLPTVPSSIASEKLTNPFMRVENENVLSYANTKDPVEAMKFLRMDKNSFKPVD